MNHRKQLINGLYHFLEEHKDDQNNFNAVSDKLAAEINEEIKSDDNTITNEYLDCLISVRDGAADRYQKAAVSGIRSLKLYKLFMDDFLHCVTLHGLGVAQ